MTTALATREEVLPFVPTNFSETLALAGHIARSGLIPETLRGKPQDVAVIILTGHEMGLSPLQSLRMISVIRGKPVMDAALIVAQCLRAKDVCSYFSLVSSDDTQATYETQRAGAPKPTTMAYTFEQAKKARLTSKENWQNYPAAMLRARCSAALARAVYPDLVAGIYDHDELDEPKAPRSAPRVVQAIEEPKPRVESSSAAPVQPVPHLPPPVAQVEDAQFKPTPAPAPVHAPAPAGPIPVVVHEARTEAGSVLRIVDVPEAHAATTVAPEPPPPADEPGSNDVTPCDELLGLLGSIPARDWVVRKNALQAKGLLSAADLEQLRKAYDAAKKGGA